MTRFMSSPMFPAVISAEVKAAGCLPAPVVDASHELAVEQVGSRPDRDQSAAVSRGSECLRDHHCRGISRASNGYYR